MKLHKLALYLTAASLAAPLAAQDQTPQTTETATPEEDQAIVVTGSLIKRNPNNSPLPLQIITTEDLARESITTPEQFIALLSTNGSGADNLASNTDVTSGAQRGINGLSAANLRGQGSGSTLVLLNGRRVAAHGLQGSAVDVNQIPFAAIERIEVLKDGASAIYGTDAIGGVINFITKTDFEGIALNGFVDITEAGDAPIYRLSGTVGYGKLDEQGFNIMAAVSKAWNGVLRGEDRSFVSGNQPNRGLSIDTRGTPIATAFPINPTAAGVGITQGGTLLGNATGTLTNLFVGGTGTTRMSGGINILDLPGGAGCSSMDGGMAYDEQLWAVPSAQFACAWDTGRAAILQQPLETLTYYGRATAKFGDHQIYAEITGSDAKSAKRFSNNQYSANNTTLPIAYPLNALTAATYNDVYDRIAGTFPGIGAVGDRTVDAVGRYGLPITFRFRCIACGTREYETETKTLRGSIGIEGPIADGWDYRAGASYARSESASVLGSGFHYRGVFNSAAQAAASGVVGAAVGRPDPRAPTAPGASAPGIVGLFNSGILNPFSVQQSPEALAGLRAISAEGVRLYSGKYEVKQLDYAITGSLFDIWGGPVQVALGVDYRKETYSFDGSPDAVLGRPDIFNAAFDNALALSQRSRTVKAVFGEVLLPIFDMLEVTGAVRLDDYSGFGTTVNPKVSAKFRPADWLMFRGSYNTGFRVPTFNQIFSGVTIAPNPGNNLVDPTTCPSGAVNPAIPGCSAIFPETVSGGNVNLGPETAEQFSFGVVFQPSPRFSASVDWWSIAVDDTIGTLTIPQLLSNISFFPDRILRDSNNIIVGLDLRNDNIGSRRTKGLEVALRGEIDAFGGILSGSLDGTYLLQKKEKFLPSAPYGPSLIGVFTFSGDLGLRWKHNANITWSNDDWAVSFSQIFRNGYKNQALPGIANGTVTRPDFNPRVKDYIIYNFAVTAKAWDKLQITAGIKNIFDTDPPFAITYDSNTGAGSSWEPRVADPRGRSFTLAAQVKF